MVGSDIAAADNIVEADAGSDDDVRKLVDNAIWAHGGLDIFFANAGISGGLASIVEQTAEDWAEILRVDLIGPFLAIKHAAPALKARGGGSISHRQLPAALGSGGAAYSAAKAGVISLVQTAAQQLSGSNIRVNAICPGLIETGMTQVIYETARKKGVADRIGELNPLKRGGEPIEIANAALFLASDESSYVNGQPGRATAACRAAIPPPAASTIRSAVARPRITTPPGAFTPTSENVVSGLLFAFDAALSSDANPSDGRPRGPGRSTHATPCSRSGQARRIRTRRERRKRLIWAPASARQNSFREACSRLRMVLALVLLLRVLWVAAAVVDPPAPRPTRAGSKPRYLRPSTVRRPSAPSRPLTTPRRDCPHMCGQHHRPRPAAPTVLQPPRQPVLAQPGAGRQRRRDQPPVATSPISTGSRPCITGSRSTWRTPGNGRCCLAPASGSLPGATPVDRRRARAKRTSPECARSATS